VKRGFLKKIIIIFYKINVQSKQLYPNIGMQNLDPDPYPNTFHDLNTPTGMSLDLYSTVPDPLLKILF
jgi:hypothetical protein